MNVLQNTIVVAHNNYTHVGGDDNKAYEFFVLFVQILGVGGWVSRNLSIVRILKSVGKNGRSLNKVNRLYPPDIFFCYWATKFSQLSVGQTKEINGTALFWCTQNTKVVDQLSSRTTKKLSPWQHKTDTVTASTLRAKFGPKSCHCDNFTWQLWQPKSCQWVVTVTAPFLTTLEAKVVKVVRGSVGCHEHNLWQPWVVRMVTETTLTTSSSGVKVVIVTTMTTIDQTNWYRNWIILGTNLGLSTLTTLTTVLVTTIKLFWWQKFWQLSLTTFRFLCTITWRNPTQIWPKKTTKNSLLKIEDI